jgi:hypothetical protein
LRALSLILIFALLSPQLLKFSALLSQFAFLLIKLPLLPGCRILLALQLIPNESTAQGTHSSADRRTGTRCADCRTDNRAAGRTYATTHQGAFLSRAKRLGTSSKGQ